MNVLLACEESQRVCVEFRKRGHNAFSCDIETCSGGHPEWHIQDNVIPLLNGNCEFWTVDGKLHKISGKWDMVIAFPPCTHLAVSGAVHFKKKLKDGRQREGLGFFCKFLQIDCDRVAIENPVGIISGNYVLEHFPDIAQRYGLPLKPTQIIQPYMFGDPFEKNNMFMVEKPSRACSDKNCKTSAKASFTNRKRKNTSILVSKRWKGKAEKPLKDFSWNSKSNGRTMGVKYDCVKSV